MKNAQKWDFSVENSNETFWGDFPTLWTRRTVWVVSFCVNGRFKVGVFSYLWVPWRNLRVSYAWPAFLKWRWSRRHPTRSPKCTGFEPPAIPCCNTAQITFGLIHEPWIRLQIWDLSPIFHRVIDKWPGLLPPNWHDYSCDVDYYWHWFPNWNVTYEVRFARFFRVWWRPEGVWDDHYWHWHFFSLNYFCWFWSALSL